MDFLFIDRGFAARRGAAILVEHRKAFKPGCQFYKFRAKRFRSAVRPRTAFGSKVERVVLDALVNMDAAFCRLAVHAHNDMGFRPAPSAIGIVFGAPKAFASRKPIHPLWDRVTDHQSRITNLTSFTAMAWGEGAESGAASV